MFDTDTMVAAISSDAGASRRLLQSVLECRPELTLLISVPLLIEYEAVMTRPEHLRAANLSAVDVAALLDAVAAIAEPVKLAYLWRPTLRDADDDMVLEAAVNGGAYGIVTFNRRDFEPRPTLPSVQVGRTLARRLPSEENWCRPSADEGRRVAGSQVQASP